MSISAERQKRNRQRLKDRGYQRLDVYIPPELWAKLEPILEPYQGKYYPGHALVAWLSDLIPEYLK